MACEVGAAVQKDSDIPVVAMVAQEKNADIINQFKDQLNIVKMPKKGGTGLQDSIDHGIELCNKKVKKEDINEFVSQYCY
jgi:glycine reductase